MPSYSRNGFSLLEVLVATAMLFGCVVVLVQLANIGREHAQSADALAVAQMACYSKMNALLCGAERIETLNKEPMNDPPGWVLSVQTEEAEQEGVRVLRVTVAEEVEEELGMSTLGGSGTLAGQGAPDETFGDEEPKGRSFTLVRWIVDTKSTESGNGFLTQPHEDGEPDAGPPDGPPPAPGPSDGDAGGSDVPN